MLFFKRILKESEPAEAAVPRVERRRARRYAINPHFPLKTVLSFVGRDDTGAPMSHSRHGWHWKGHLLDCSEQGSRFQIGQAPKVEVRDQCDLILTVEDFSLTIPCQITNIREHAEGFVFGLKHEIEEESTRIAYGQLLEILALGTTLKPYDNDSAPDESGYLVVHYLSDQPARMSLWLHPDDKSVVAFEFQLRDNLVRAALGHGMEFLTGEDARPAPAAKALEIQRLFRWVVPSLAPAIPPEVCKFLRHYVE